MQGKTAVPPSMKLTYTMLIYNINILIRNFDVSHSWQSWYFVPAWVGGIQEAPSQVGGHNRWKLIIYRKPKWMLVWAVEIKILFVDNLVAGEGGEKQMPVRNHHSFALQTQIIKRMLLELFIHVFLTLILSRSDEVRLYKSSTSNNCSWNCSFFRFRGQYQNERESLSSSRSVSIWTRKFCWPSFERGSLQTLEFF